MADGGEGGGVELYSRRPKLLRVSDKPSCWYITWYFTKCTPNTDMCEIITERQGPSLHVLYIICTMTATRMCYRAYSTGHLHSVFDQTQQNLQNCWPTPRQKQKPRRGGCLKQINSCPKSFCRLLLRRKDSTVWVLWLLSFYSMTDLQINNAQSLSNWMSYRVYICSKLGSSLLATLDHVTEKAFPPFQELNRSVWGKTKQVQVFQQRFTSEMVFLNF